VFGCFGYNGTGCGQYGTALGCSREILLVDDGGNLVAELEGGATSIFFGIVLLVLSKEPKEEPRGGLLELI
jgi:hypothetical protein